MRERWARRIAILTGGLVVVLAIVFANHQNPPRHEKTPAPAAGQPVAPADEAGTPAATTAAIPAPASPAPADKPAARSVEPSRVALGQEVYADRACARCHSIAGRGNDRSPLDGVGARLSEAEIRAWVTPSAEAKGFQARHANVDLTPAQRDALVAYLRSLR